MDSLIASARNTFAYYSGYTQARLLTDWWAVGFSKLTSLITLPLPFLSLLTFPLYFSFSTNFALFSFYLAWSAIVFSHDPLLIEVVGTLCVRLVFFVAPALLFLAFDCILPDVSANIKSYGKHAVPLRLDRKRLTRVVAISVFNTLASVAVQAVLEYIFTNVLHMRSLLKVSSMTIPLPLSMFQDVIRGFLFRGVLHYSIHRFVLHTWKTPLKTWHAQVQHSIRFPFSLVAAYDALPCHLLVQWLPTYIPAVLYRFHILTWLLFLALVNIEQLLIYSGYSILPSAIVIGGAARRTDAHFVTFNRRLSNFGHWGILDYVIGTNCKETTDVVDDLQSEAEKHRVKQRASAAIDGARIGFEEEEKKNKPRKQSNQSDSDAGSDTEPQKVSKIAAARRRITRSRQA